MNNRTAILIFANSAEFEASKKPFQNSTVLFKALNKETIHIVEETGIPYFLYNEKNQVGSTFGERFNNAILSVYEKGYDSVITIGNDSPHLQSKHILKAASQLKHDKIVLGPSKDGGFYLMGLKKKHFNSTAFLKLPWQTSKLNRSISNLIHLQNIEVSYLQSLSDIDKMSDIKFVFDSKKRLSEAIKVLLKSFISIVKRVISGLIILIETLFQTLHFNKGSPQLAS